jgi:hypothetical protein
MLERPWRSRLHLTAPSILTGWRTTVVLHHYGSGAENRTPISWLTASGPAFRRHRIGSAGGTRTLIVQPMRPGMFPLHHRAVAPDGSDPSPSA